jgi:predicted RNase H-like HicB family nuclease
MGSSPPGQTATAPLGVIDTWPSRRIVLLRMKTYTAVVERCPETNLFVGYIPGFPGAHSQAATLDELNKNLKEVVEMRLEDGEPRLEAEFIGTQTVSVP